MSAAGSTPRRFRHSTRPVDREGLAHGKPLDSRGSETIPASRVLNPCARGSRTKRAEANGPERADECGRVEGPDTSAWHRTLLRLHRQVRRRQLRGCGRATDRPGRSWECRPGFAWCSLTSVVVDIYQLQGTSVVRKASMIAPSGSWRAYGQIRATVHLPRKGKWCRQASAETVSSPKSVGAIPGFTTAKDGTLRVRRIRKCRKSFTESMSANRRRAGRYSITRIRPPIRLPDVGLTTISTGSTPISAAAATRVRCHRPQETSSWPGAGR